MDDPALTALPCTGPYCRRVSPTLRQKLQLFYVFTYIIYINNMYNSLLEFFKTSIILV